MRLHYVNVYVCMRKRVQYNNIVRICIYVFCMFVDVCIRVVI